MFMSRQNFCGNNDDHPEMLPGEEFYSNVWAEHAERRVQELNAGNDGYIYRLGEVAFEQDGASNQGWRPIFQKPASEKENSMAIQEITEEEDRFTPVPARFTHCDNCHGLLSEDARRLTSFNNAPLCQCGENQMPTCNYCGNAQVDCRGCDEDSYLND